MIHKVESYSLSLDDAIGPEMSTETTGYEVFTDGLCRDEQEMRHWIHQMKILRRAFPQIAVALFVPEKIR